MTRMCTFATLALLSVSTMVDAGGTDKDKILQVQGKLTKEDVKDPQRNGPSRIHLVPLKAGKAYTIDMVSPDVDSYLRLQDNKGKQLDEDDDSGGGVNARIIFNCTKDGEYKVVCTTYGPDMSGSYTLTVKLNVSTQKPASSHVRMIGQPAPDFRGDFALNGQVSKLSDLKGKVVLLDFCEVRSGQSIKLIPQLLAWRKAYQSAGLVIVGVTYYTSDINQSLRFDKTTGKVVSIAKADPTSDKALLKAFAEHYKIDHLLMALSKEDAVHVFDAYAVNGIPQLVLIDRSGKVRLIDTSGGKNSTAIETEIKNLIEEK